MGPRVGADVVPDHAGRQGRHQAPRRPRPRIPRDGLQVRRPRRLRVGPGHGEESPRLAPPPPRDVRQARRPLLPGHHRPLRPRPGHRHRPHRTPRRRPRPRRQRRTRRLGVGQRVRSLKIEETEKEEDFQLRRNKITTTCSLSRSFKHKPTRRVKGESDHEHHKKKKEKGRTPPSASSSQPASQPAAPSVDRSISPTNKKEKPPFPHYVPRDVSDDPQPRLPPPYRTTTCASPDPLPPYTSSSKAPSTKRGPPQ
mmetsp:Transcript_14615/g.47603  ORF Transcript_14615/g.47603 Transcript_14615/m.47603 type:complete len:254 (-) Transcript_14615:258-1019(-)